MSPAACTAISCRGIGPWLGQRRALFRYARTQRLAASVALAARRPTVRDGDRVTNNKSGDASGSPLSSRLSELGIAPMNNNPRTRFRHRKPEQVCAQQRVIQSAAEELAVTWAADAPAVRSARALRLAPAVAWLPGGTGPDAAMASMRITISGLFQLL